MTSPPLPPFVVTLGIAVTVLGHYFNPSVFTKCFVHAIHAIEEVGFLFSSICGFVFANECVGVITISNASCTILSKLGLVFERCTVLSAEKLTRWFISTTQTWSNFFAIDQLKLNWIDQQWLFLANMKIQVCFFNYRFFTMKKKLTLHFFSGDRKIWYSFFRFIWIPFYANTLPCER